MALKLALVVGARPNFIKVAPLIRELKNRETRFYPILVHTGQPYDPEMSGTLFEDLGIPRPDFNLSVDSSNRSVQTARVIERFEAFCKSETPDCILVFGDIDSTLACALVGAKSHIPVAHVEAGLRSFDRSMPEEINRVVTDVLSDFLFTPDATADKNLLQEGIPEERIFRVGDITVDALLWEKRKARSATILEDLGLDRQKSYGVLTLHRAGNVDNPEILRHLVGIAITVSDLCPLVFPIHPRTEKRLKEFHLSSVLGRLYISDEGKKQRGVIAIKPVGYRDFLKLLMEAAFVLTDSGGIQKETTLLGVPCLTLRETTEWPLTLSHGTNRLLGSTPNSRRVQEIVYGILANPERSEIILPELWDGHTSERILHILEKKLRL